MTEKKLSLVAQFVDKVSPNMKKATKSAEDFGKKSAAGMGMATTAIKLLKGALIALGVALTTGAILQALGRMVQTAMEAQVAVTALDATIKSMSRTTPNLSQSLQELAKSLQRVTMFSDETIMDGQAFLATYADITDELMPRATRVMVDFAAKTGNGMRQAANAIGKASMGMTGELSQMGITFSEATLESKDFLMMLDDIETQVGGLAEALGQTFQGRIEKVKNSFADIQKEFGLMIIKSPTLNALLELLVDTMDAFALSISKLDETQVEEWIQDRISDFTGFVRFLGTVTEGWQTFIIEPIVNGLIEMRRAFEDFIQMMINLLKLLPGGDDPDSPLGKTITDMERQIQLLRAGNAGLREWMGNMRTNAHEASLQFGRWADVVETFMEKVKSGEFTITEAMQGIAQVLSLPAEAVEEALDNLNKTGQWPPPGMFDPETGLPIPPGGDDGGGGDPVQTGIDAATRMGQSFGASIGSALETSDWESAMASVGNQMGSFLSSSIAEAVGGFGGGLLGGLVGGFVSSVFGRRKRQVEKPTPVKVVNWGDMTTALLKGSTTRNVSPMITTGGNSVMSANFSRGARI